MEGYAFTQKLSMKGNRDADNVWKKHGDSPDQSELLFILIFTTIQGIQEDARLDEMSS